MIKLNLGCGSAKLSGWTNVDSDPNNRPEVQCDLRGPLPWVSQAVDYIHMEHFFEHINREEQQRLLGECWRVLKPGGVVRISGPDLRAVCALYLTGDVELWRSKGSGEGWATICEFMNNAFYGWGHRFIPDEEYLTQALLRAGFADAARCEFGQSSHPDLCDIEVRGGSRNEDFVMEGRK